MQQTKCDEKLTAIEYYAVQTEPNIATKLIQSLSQVQAHALVNETQVLVIIEGVEKTDTVLLIIRVALVKS